MTPVISPWVFYAISVADVVKFAAAIFAIFIGIGAIITTLANRFDYGEDDEDYLKWKPIAKRTTIVATVCLVFAIFIPSEKTITKMIVAQNVTYERVEVVTDTVQTVYEDIMGLFEDYDDGE